MSSFIATWKRHVADEFNDGTVDIDAVYLSPALFSDMYKSCILMPTKSDRHGVVRVFNEYNRKMLLVRMSPTRHHLSEKEDLGKGDQPGKKIQTLTLTSVQVISTMVYKEASEGPLSRRLQKDMHVLALVDLVSKCSWAPAQKLSIFPCSRRPKRRW